MVESKKIETHLQQLPQKKTSPLPLSIRLPPEFEQLFSFPHLLTFLKKHLFLPPSFSKQGEAQTTKYSVAPRVFLYMLVYI